MTGEELKNRAEHCGIAAALESLGRPAEIELPLTAEFLAQSITELNLTVRSHNGLMRAGLDTVGKLADAIMSEPGLECIRNLGKKSITEIKTVLLTEAYARLGEGRRETFWEKVKELNGV